MRRPVGSESILLRSHEMKKGCAVASPRAAIMSWRRGLMREVIALPMAREARSREVRGT